MQLLSACGGHAATIRLLLKHGAVVDAADDYGMTPLLFAVEHGHVHATQLLLAAGASVRVANRRGFAALHVAVYSNCDEIVNLLLTAGANVDQCKAQTLLFMAARFGHDEIVHTLLCWHSRVETLSYGKTPLCIAAFYGHASVVELLLRYGSADVNAASATTTTPLLLAVQRNRVDIVRMLVAANAVNRCKPLVAAVRDGRRDCVALLLASGSVKKSVLQSAMQTAAACQRYECAVLLVAAGAALVVPRVPKSKKKNKKRQRDLYVNDIARRWSTIPTNRSAIDGAMWRIRDARASIALVRKKTNKKKRQRK